MDVTSQEGVESVQKFFPLEMIAIPTDKMLHAGGKGLFNNTIFSKSVGRKLHMTLGKSRGSLERLRRTLEIFIRENDGIGEEGAE